MNKYNVIAGVVSIVVSMLGFFLAFRAELKKHTDEIVKRRLKEERRHTRNERRILAVEQKISDLESYLTKRLDYLTKRTSELNNFIINIIKERL